MASVQPRGRGRRTINEINMVPFIDVMLVLLIIFMVTAPLISPSQINLPSVGQAAQQPERFVHVVIDEDSQVRVSEGRGKSDAPAVALDQVAKRVQALQAGGDVGQQGNAANVPVVISADKAVKYETVIGVMDRLQRAGVARVGLSVQIAQ
ncbi:MAG: biopolymer transporter ExbD [Hydrogenophaga sp.]|jgi:biopolymer transport protein TolR|nr:biopolymer transporter ExbD [Hydrogenophaga sp.]